MKLAKSNDKIDIFNDDEIDYFKELLNIGHGHSAAVLAELLDQFVTLNVPEIHFVPANQFKNMISSLVQKNNTYTLQSFWGEISGRTFFVLDKSSMASLRKIFDEDDVEDDDIVLELINIMNATLISRIAMELETEVTFDMPAVETSRDISQMNKTMEDEYREAIVLTTTLNFKEIGVDVEMIIFMHEKTITWIHNAITKKIDGLLEWS